MDDTPDRLQIVETARKLILSEGEMFSLTSLYKELSCSRSRIRRYFPSKASLVTAAFGGEPVDSVAKPAVERFVDEILPASTGHTDDWITRRFRVFERAIATLEVNIDDVRQENAKSVAELEKKLSEIQSSALSTDFKETGPVLRDDFESDLEKPPVINSSPEKVPVFSGEFRPADPVPDSEPLIAPDGEHVEKVPSVSRRKMILENREICFTIAPDDGSSEKGDWKNLTILGVTAFSAALLLAIIVLAFTSGAGASYVSDSQIQKTAAQPPRAAKPKSAIDALDSGSGIVINSTTATKPPARPATLTAKNLGLENFAIGHITLNEAGSLSLETKVKLALAYLKGDAVRADPMMGAFWSGAAAQQGNAEAQFILGTLYAKGIAPDAEQAFRWYSSAAVLGNPKAMHNLAIALLNGDGVAKDKTSAVNWLVRAANLGYRDSAFDLGVLYERGEGVAQNSRTALSWYDNAAGMGDQEAAKRAALLRSDGLEASNRN